jgi:hypothetical protein
MTPAAGLTVNEKDLLLTDPRSTNFSAPCKLLKIQCHSGFASTNPENQWTGSSMVEQLTLNQRVGGSSPPRFTKIPCKSQFLASGTSRRVKQVYLWFTERDAIF